MLRADPEPRGDFEAMLESEVQVAPMLAVKPKRDFSEKLTSPKAFAIIVRDDDPEEGKFVETTLEIGAAQDPAETTQKEKAFEKSLLRVTLAIAESAIPAPEENFKTIDDDDSHLVTNVEDLDIRDATEASKV